MQKQNEMILNLGLLLVVLIAVNLIFSKVPVKMDITEDGLYSLSEGTKKILGNLEDTVRIKFYFTRSAESAPIQFKAYGQRVQEFLQEYVDASSGKIELEVYDPRPDTEDEEWAIKYGLQAAQLPTGENFFLGAAFLSARGEESVPLFNPQREPHLEYDITQKISQIRSTGRKTVGILSGLEVFGNNALPFQMPGQPAPREDWQFVRELKKTWDVQKIEMAATELPQMDLLVVIHPPQNLSEAMQYALDQYVLSGGRLMVLVDPSATSEGMMSQSKSSDLGRLLRKWGVAYDKGQVVADFENTLQVNSPRGVIQYPVWMNLTDANMAEGQVPVQELESLMFIEAGSLGAIQGATGIEFIPLVKTSKSSGNITASELMGEDPTKVLRAIRPGELEQTVAAMVRGKFSSAFDSRPASASMTEPHRAEAMDSNTIMVIADTDFLFDRYSIRRLNLLGQSMMTAINDNLTFLQNAAEFMLGDENLISIRSRGRSQRPFERVLAMQKDAQLKWKEKEEELNQKLEEVQSRINDLQNHKVEGGRVVLSREQISELEKLKEAERQARQDRREVRKRLREDIESTGRRLAILNVFLLPFLVGLFGAMRVWSHSSRGGR